ncbi:NAD(P)H-dependent oxidoreductase [uncultured Chryseobacterium sp.]|uniref:NAD(P)H-dependent oxidoreductase n=1 Tax=uncultured Chryseobacterium sp. TaxID=259322 RepID=UPI0025FCD752|nr:NAD(P)H-dependent oxidoreductase [uncultured Chryseobacterium sp.]
MRHLIIYAHPHEESLNYALFKTVIDTLTADENHELIIRDLNAIQFDPVLSSKDLQDQRMGTPADDIRKEQEYMAWAECITFIYPIWWTGLPAIMKGYIDRVFTYGFAYRYDQGIQKGLLTGKKTVIINTHGKSRGEYEKSGMDQALLLTSDQGIFSYCGLNIIRHFFFDRADRAAAEQVEKWQQQIRSVYS